MDSDSRQVDEGVAGSQWAGVVVNGGHDVVTAFHAVHSHKEFTIFFDSGELGAANLDRVSTNLDLALLKLKKPAPFSIDYSLDSDLLEAGERVYAIGNPFGRMPLGVSAGIVSALGVKLYNPQTMYQGTYLVADTRTCPGFSGGGLVNESGQLVGMITGRLVEQSDGNDFSTVTLAVPANLVRAFVSHESGKNHLDLDEAKFLLVRTAPTLFCGKRYTLGALAISELPSIRCGRQETILAVNRMGFHSAAEFFALLEYCGRPVHLLIKRGSQLHEVEIP